MDTNGVAWKRLVIRGMYKGRGERIKLKYCCVKSSRRRIVDMNICDGRRDPRITSTTPQQLSRKQDRTCVFIILNENYSKIR